jgi:hypothetical protein
MQRVKYRELDMPQCIAGLHGSSLRSGASDVAGVRGCGCGASAPSNEHADRR